MAHDHDHDHEHHHHEHGHDHMHYGCCGETFHGDAPFKAHREEVHGDEAWVCPEHEEDLGSWEAFREHLQTEHGA